MFHGFFSHRTERERRPRATPLTDEQREEKNKRRREDYRERIITGEQREENNRKRREAYKRKKSHALNKENDPG